MADLAAVTTALDGDARFDAAIQAGNNTEVRRLLMEEVRGEMVPRSAIPQAEILRAIAPALPDRTQVQIEQLKLLLPIDSIFDARDRPQVSAVRAVIADHAQAASRFDTVCVRPKRVVDDFDVGDGGVSLDDVRLFVAQITKALVNQPEPAERVAKRAVIERVSAKLARLRQHMINQGEGERFARFRFAGHLADSSPSDFTELVGDGFAEGGVYQQPENRREAFIDTMMQKVGLSA